LLAIASDARRTTCLSRPRPVGQVYKGGIFWDIRDLHGSFFSHAFRRWPGTADVPLHNPGRRPPQAASTGSGEPSTPGRVKTTAPMPARCSTITDVFTNSTDADLLPRQSSTTSARTWSTPCGLLHGHPRRLHLGAAPPRSSSSAPASFLTLAYFTTTRTATRSTSGRDGSGRIPRAGKQQHLHQLDGRAHVRRMRSGRRTGWPNTSPPGPASSWTSWIFRASRDHPGNVAPALSVRRRPGYPVSSGSSTAYFGLEPFRSRSYWPAGSIPHEYLGGGNGIATTTQILSKQMWSWRWSCSEPVLDRDQATQMGVLRARTEGEARACRPAPTVLVAAEIARSIGLNDYFMRAATMT